MYNIIAKIFTYKIIRYGVVGVISTFIHFLVAFSYIYFMNSSVLQSNMIGFLIAYIFSYLMQSKHVFNHKINIERAIKYFIVQLSSLLLSIGFSTIFYTYNSYIKTIIVVGLLPLFTFTIHKLWTFKASKS